MVADPGYTGGPRIAIVEEGPAAPECVELCDVDYCDVDGTLCGNLCCVVAGRSLLDHTEDQRLLCEGVILHMAKVKDLNAPGEVGEVWPWGQDQRDREVRTDPGWRPNLAPPAEVEAPPAAPASGAPAPRDDSFADLAAWIEGQG